MSLLRDLTAVALFGMACVAGAIAEWADNTVDRLAPTVPTKGGGRP